MSPDAGGRTIHATFQYHAHAFGEGDTADGQAYSLERHTDVYYIRMESGGRWVAPDGSPISLPLTREVAQASCRVYESMPPRLGYGVVDTTYLLYNLCRMKAVGVARWAELEAGDVRRRYFKGAFKIGAGPLLPDDEGDRRRATTGRSLRSATACTSPIDADPSGGQEVVERTSASG